jgi:hypothetical protein
MNQAIGDEAAIAFSIGFYQGLGANRSIEESYKLGCVQIRLNNIPEYLTPVLIKGKKKNPQRTINTNSRSMVHLKTSESDYALQVPLAQFRKHTVMIGHSGSGRTLALNWLTELLWKGHGIPFLAIRHWPGSIDLGEGVSHLSLERRGTSFVSKMRPRLTLDTESKIGFRLDEFQSSLGVEHLSTVPTVIDITLKKMDLIRIAFQLLWTRLASNLTLEHRTENLRFVIAMDEFDGTGGQMDLQLFANNLRDLRRCGIGFLFVSSGYHENLMREVRNFVIFSHRKHRPLAPADVHQAIEENPDLHNNLSIGNAVFSAAGVIPPTMIEIPNNRSRLAIV